MKLRKWVQAVVATIALFAFMVIGVDYSPENLKTGALVQLSAFVVICGCGYILKRWGDLQ